MTKFIVAQGDVLVRQIETVPAGAVQQLTNGVATLARGEATGHHHSIFSNGVRLFREDGSGSGLFMQVTGPAPVRLEHQEHAAIEIPLGNYEVVPQRTYHVGVVRAVLD